MAGVELEGAPKAIANISNPSLLVYPATKPNGKAILMCPGGGLSKISIGHEGRDMAAWFNAQGITYAVLKYRMPNGHREVPLDDVRQGLRILRNYSEEWKITKVGVMGASIGGCFAGHGAIILLFYKTPHPPDRPRFSGRPVCTPDCAHRRAPRAPEAASEGQPLPPWSAEDGWSAPQHAQLPDEEGR